MVLFNMEEYNFVRQVKKKGIHFVDLKSISRLILFSAK